MFVFLINNLRSYIDLAKKSYNLGGFIVTVSASYFIGFYYVSSDIDLYRPALSQRTLR